MVKLSILLKRHPDLSHDAFVEHHRTHHAALFTSLPVVREHVRRYVQQHPVADVIEGFPPPAYDGITELWFDDVAAVGALFGDPSYLEQVRPDEARFLDLDACELLLCDERTVLDGVARGH